MAMGFFFRQYMLAYPLDAIAGETYMKFLEELGINWISVKDRLPELKVSDKGLAEWPSDNVLACDSKKDLYVVYLSSCGWNEVGTGCGCCCSNLEVTHWMPLPEPPK